MGQITISMNNDTRKVLDGLAQKIGLSRSSYLRMLVKEKVNKLKKTEESVQYLS